MRVRIKERGFGWLLCFINVFFFFIKWVSSSDNIPVLPLLLAVYVTKKKYIYGDVVLCG
jgi:hypothetical protein